LAKSYQSELNENEDRSAEHWWPLVPLGIPASNPELLVRQCHWAERSRYVPENREGRMGEDEERDFF
jgi:hypothetical protein